MRACFDAFYADIHPEKLVFDTNRMWTTKLPALVELFPDLRMICCVRNPAWIIDSVERLTRQNKFEPSKIFNFDLGGTVYSRAEGLSSGAGMLGFALNALREAVYGEHADRLLLVRYETLTARSFPVVGTGKESSAEATASPSGSCRTERPKKGALRGEPLADFAAKLETIRLDCLQAQAWRSCGMADTLGRKTNTGAFLIS